MTFDDDFLLFNVPDEGITRVFVKSVGLSWPPPKYIDFNGSVYRQVSHSRITDEQRQEMTHVMRGAAYEIDLYPLETRQ